MFTKTPFKKGDQVYISYGKHSNPVLLHYYGFAVNNNPGMWAQTNRKQNSVKSLL
jgi:hypothetical protein